MANAGAESDRRLQMVLETFASDLRNGSIEGITITAEGEIKITGHKRPLEAESARKHQVLPREPQAPSTQEAANEQFGFVSRREYVQQGGLDEDFDAMLHNTNFTTDDRGRVQLPKAKCQRQGSNQVWYGVTKSGLYGKTPHSTYRYTLSIAAEPELPSHVDAAELAAKLAKGEAQVGEKNRKTYCGKSKKPFPVKNLLPYVGAEGARMAALHRLIHIHYNIRQAPTESVESSGLRAIQLAYNEDEANNEDKHDGKNENRAVWA